MVVELPSGCAIERPYDRLLAFCHGEYAYYDAIPSAEPNRIDPLDVLVTVAMNSFVNSAVKVHRVHQGMATNCEPILPTIPEAADVIDLDRWSAPLRDLLHAAVQAPGVLIPVAKTLRIRLRQFAARSQGSRPRSTRVPSRVAGAVGLRSGSQLSSPGGT